MATLDVILDTGGLAAVPAVAVTAGNSVDTSTDKAAKASTPVADNAGAPTGSKAAKR